MELPILCPILHRFWTDERKTVNSCTEKTVQETCWIYLPKPFSDPNTHTHSHCHAHTHTQATGTVLVVATHTLADPTHTLSGPNAHTHTQATGTVPAAVLTPPLAPATTPMLVYTPLQN